MTLDLDELERLKAKSEEGCECNGRPDYDRPWCDSCEASSKFDDAIELAAPELIAAVRERDELKVYSASQDEVIEELDQMYREETGKNLEAKLETAEMERDEAVDVLKKIQSGDYQCVGDDGHDCAYLCVGKGLIDPFLDRIKDGDE